MARVYFSIAVVIGAFALTACTRNSDSARKAPHLDLEMSTREYAAALEANPQVLGADDAAKLKPVLDMGKRVLQWVDFVNQHRDAAHRISLSSEATQPAYPVERPRELNVSIVLKEHQDILAGLPAEMARVLVDGADFTANPPVSDEEFSKWGHQVDYNYQLGARWLLLSPYLSELKARKQKDIRGYYHLSHESDLDGEISSWTNLEAGKRDQLRGWMIGLCFNKVGSDTQCAGEIDTAVKANGTPRAFYDKYAANSADLYQSFFRLGELWVHDDFTWHFGATESISVPFVDPKDETVKAYLRDNIQDEWKWGTWQLTLAFQNGSESSMAHVSFEEGVTPHVEDPNTIVMDRNQPMTEYDSRWTIRHEFGHILGFPDCYLEFYDEDQQKMISYQLDTSNLMCSRRGKLKQTHFDEMKRVYGQSR